MKERISGILGFYYMLLGFTICCKIANSRVIFFMERRMLIRDAPKFGVLYKKSLSHNRSK